MFEGLQVLIKSCDKIIEKELQKDEPDIDKLASVYKSRRKIEDAKEGLYYI